MNSRYNVHALLLATALALMAWAGRPAFAEGSATSAAAAESLTTVVVTASRTSECVGLTPDEARQHAQQARREGAHRKAAECFRIAGDHLQADRSLVRASADTGAETTRKAAATAEIAKNQARRLKAAFR